MRSAILSLFVLLAAGTAQAAVPLPGHDWTKLAVADDYVIYSHASDRATRDIADRLMTFRNALSLVTKFKVEAPQPVTLIVFRSYTEMLPYAQAVMGAKRDFGAVSFHDGDGDTILLNGDQWLHSVGPEVYHELTHTFTFRGNATLPLWFIEGIAEFYSTFDVIRGQVKIGVPPREHLDWLRSRGLKPLVNVLNADRKSPEYQGGSRTNDFYAESWLLVHYLLLGNPERGKAASQFLTLLAANQPPERACQLAFGISVADLERELLRYLEQGSMNSIHYTLDSSNKAPIGVPAPVGREEVIYSIGNLLARSSSSREEGKAFLGEAMQLNDHRAETLADLGMLAEANGKQGSGDPLFEKAVALGNGGATVYRQYGRSLIDRQHEHPDAVQVAKARSLFEKAVALNPKVAEAHIGLGMTYLLTPGDVHVGISELEKGLELDPGNINAAMNLVVLLVRAGERQRAEEVIDKKIAPVADAEMLRQARALIEKK
jgi:tetratricopeptide (TPR) repeat protein